MILRIIATTFVCIFCLSLQAQNNNLSSLHMFDKYNYFSAYAGMDGSLHASANYRSQWNGIKGMPIIQGVQAHMPLYVASGAVGVKLRSSGLGAQKENQASISYNYVKSNNWGLLSFGGHFGVNQFRLNGNELRTPDGVYEDGVVNHNDPELAEFAINNVGILYGVSALFRNAYMQAGLSISQLPSYKLNLTRGGYRKATVIRGFFEWPVQIFDEFLLIPNMLISSDLVEVQSEISATIKYSGNIFGGLGLRGYSTRSVDAIILIVGWEFNKNYQIAYSYDAGISKLRTTNQGSHEIMISYDLNKKIGAGIPPKVIFNPRYM